ncbi:MAG: carbon-nitrogen hydrolase family protein [Planctomycetota bacterium]|nr:carbon-nitrogen hydrolase family protein [Planctomycetota bacterium]
MTIKVSTGLTPRSWELLQARSNGLREQIERSNKESWARPLVLGVFQKRNHCNGRAGVAENLAQMIAGIEEAGRRGVQMLAMPEMALQGYSTPAGGSVEQAIAANRDLAIVVGQSEELRCVRDAARAAKMVVAFGFGERDGTEIYNSIGLAARCRSRTRLISPPLAGSRTRFSEVDHDFHHGLLVDADGKWLGVRRKNPLFPWDYETKVFAEPAPSLRCCVFDTKFGRVGLSNCFDGEFPETVRKMALEGAQVLLWCNAPCGDSPLGGSQRLNQSGTHAQFNGLYVACASCVSSDTTGTSCIYSPVGEPLAVLSVDEEEIGVASANLALHTNWAIWRDRLHQWPLGPNPV